MAVFRPFRGCRYSSQVSGSLAELLCPPYDMIGPALKETLQGKSPYNAVHLEGGEQPDPRDPEAGYRQAAAAFQQWLNSGVLAREEVPSFYLMRHTYPDGSASRQQLGLFGNVLVEGYDQGSVLPHEFTREPAVLDRVALLEASRTQFSPLMTLYRDSEGTLLSVLHELMSAPPALETGGSRESNIGKVAFWQIKDQETQRKISEFFDGRPIFLADGHHRYEAALRYRNSQLDKGGQNPDAASNYVMMSLTEFGDPGLQLLPYHKVMGGLSEEQLQRFEENLLELFEPDTMDLGQCGGAEGFASLVIERGKSRHTVGVIGPGGDTGRLLQLREGIDWRQWGDLAVSEAWVLDEQVMKPALGDNLGPYVDYSHDAGRTVEMVREGSQQLGFLLKPFPLDAFEAIVGGGRRLPSKSTFFYPKLPTGLVFNRLDGNI